MSSEAEHTPPETPPSEGGGPAPPSLPTGNAEPHRTAETGDVAAEEPGDRTGTAHAADAPGEGGTAHAANAPGERRTEAGDDTGAGGAESGDPTRAGGAGSGDPTRAGGAESGDPTGAGGAESDEDTGAGDVEAGAEGEGAPAGAPSGAEGEGPKKKKRRRKRKKKVEGEAGAAHDGGAHPGHDDHAREHHERHPSQRPATERAPFHVGEEVFGKVTAVLDTAVMVDLSGKALAIFDRMEMEPDDLVPSVGDRFVARVHNDGARGGLVVLTRKPLREEEAKPWVELAAKDGSHVLGLVTGVIKGGVEVDLMGLRAFAPASGMDLHPQNANLAGLVGQRLDFKVIQYKNAGRDVVVTRRPMLEAEAHERRKHALGLLTEGQVLEGVVRTVVDWGVFVALPDAENLEGLVHASEASHDHHHKLADLFKPGDPIQVKILKIDDKGKIWLSRKALIEDPWAAAREKYAPGTRHRAKVLRLLEFGAFVELEPAVEGLIHVADLSLTRIEHPKEVLSEGQEIDVVVHRFDPRDKKISLHLAPKPEHEAEEPQKISKSATLKVEVIKHEASGLVVRVLGVTGRGARGFIPAGQTATPRGTDLRKHFKLGTVLDAKVIDIDPRRHEPKLSIRAMHEDEERKAHREYRAALQREGGFGTLGDLLGTKLKGAGGSNQ